LILKKLRGQSKKPEIEISWNCFPKGKHVDQVHEFVDRIGPVHRGSVAIAALRSSPELGLRPLWYPRAPTEGGGGERWAREVNGGVAAAREAVGRRLTGGGASARKGDDEGALRAKRRSVGGVGVFTEGRAAFYIVEVRRGRPSAFNGRR
jgi:hypothetical protein